MLKRQSIDTCFIPSWIQGIKQKDLADTIGFKSRVSEILNKMRKLTLEMIRKLNEELNISTSILIKEY